MRSLQYFKGINEEDTKKESDTKVDNKDRNDEEEFIKMFDDNAFVETFNDDVKQYVSENLLEDNYNSFVVLPYIEYIYKDETYGISIEFESSISININDDGKVVETNYSDVENIKFKTPTMDNVMILEDTIGKEKISQYIKESILQINKVAR